ncbi:MAG: NUDIX domain-containing protein [Rhodovarius sp.]|nr:NUDIX domain-containing protein [Rhodovarius sp.]MCX7931699.1 NUDIX domain-containing protein [Rhodovarius sp.]MDW8313840.1 NUDIX domain-containing protein [Rhodovarius sp.]
MPSEGASAPSPAPPRPAATLMLLRDGPAGLEVFMVVRHRQIDFAGGAMVFPGGRVDPADATLGDPFRIAAIREGFEESGILLARRGGVMLGAHDLPRDRPFPALLAEYGLSPATDALVHVAHWITPVDMPKRFDTHFFAAEAPVRQIARHDGGEAVAGRWLRPEEALRAAEEGRATLVFATRLNLMKLARHRRVADALAGAGPVVTVQPEPITGPDGTTWLRIPEEAGYGASLWRAATRPMAPRR